VVGRGVVQGVHVACFGDQHEDGVVEQRAVERIDLQRAPHEHNKLHSVGSVGVGVGNFVLEEWEFVGDDAYPLSVEQSSFSRELVGFVN